MHFDVGPMKSSYLDSREISRAKTELGILLGGMFALTTAGTWLAGRLGVPFGWRLAGAACVAVTIVGSARLAYHRRAPTWRWFGAIVALWGLILLTNALADVRLW